MHEPTQEPIAETVSLWQSDLLNRLPGIWHGVTERTGGVSVAPYASLNLGLHVGDAPERVRENRRRLARVADCEITQIACAEQVHGAAAARVLPADAGRGAWDYANNLPGTDALVTDAPGLLLTLFFADCLPILLADPERRVVAVAHAGWRGLVGGVIENTLRTMGDTAGGIRPEAIYAAVGPGIGVCCFEVGPEVAAHFDADLIAATPSGKPSVDLPRAAARRLAAAGLAASHIDVCRDCTACHTDRFFSHRREGGKTGRMGACITLRRD